jgi:hypothetical protein
MGETDTTEQTVMLPQNQATYGLALPRVAAEGSSCATPWRMASPEASSFASKFPPTRRIGSWHIAHCLAFRISADCYAIDSRSGMPDRLLTRDGEGPATSKDCNGHASSALLVPVQEKN